jgi:hypothetical protein
MLIPTIQIGDVNRQVMYTIQLFDIQHNVYMRRGEPKSNNSAEAVVDEDSKKTRAWCAK